MSVPGPGNQVVIHLILTSGRHTVCRILPFNLLTRYDPLMEKRFGVADIAPQLFFSHVLMSSKDGLLCI